MLVFRVAVILVLLILIGRMVCRKRVLWGSLIICVVLCALLAVHITGTMVNRQRMKSFDEEVYAKIVSIPWGDEEFMQRSGFSDLQSGWRWHYYYQSESVKENVYSSGVRFSIEVKEADEAVVEELRLLPHHVGELYVKYSDSGVYDNVFCEFLGLPSGVIRDCDIYCNGYLIWIREINFETIEQSLVGEFILQI